MSKITFRADDELITQLEEFDDSKSEVMRQALREYLETRGDGMVQAETTSSRTEPDSDSLDELVADRVDALITDRLEDTFAPSQPQDINVNIALDGQTADSVERGTGQVNTGSVSSSDVSHAANQSKTTDGGDENAGVQDGTTCSQCGETVGSSHVYCPNCGEKTSHRVFCDCGDEIRSDWAFCPSCGRRTPAADVLDQP